MKKTNQKRKPSVKKATPKKAAKKATKKPVKKSAPKKAASKTAPKNVVPKKAAKKPVKKASPKKTAPKKNAPKKTSKKPKNVVKKVVITTTTTTTTTVNPTETHYLLILDESSSMGSVKQSTFNGLNEQIQTIKDLVKKFPDQQYYINIVKFSDYVRPLIENVAAKDANLLNESDYTPNGMTALLDAIGTSVTNLKFRVGSKLNSGEASAFVVILTDGEENVSRQYDAPKVKELISSLEKTGMWTFTFIGANQDSVLTARSLGVSASNTINYTASADGTSLAFATAGASLNRRATYTSAGLYAATTNNVMSSIAKGMTNLGEDASLLDLSGDVSKEELEKAAEDLKNKSDSNS